MTDYFKSTSDATTLAAGVAKVVATWDLSHFRTKSFGVKNTGANALTAALIEATHVSPSAVDADWETVDNAAFATLASGAFKSFNVADDARPYWRLKLTSAAGSTVKAHVNAH